MMSTRPAIITQSFPSPRPPLVWVGGIKKGVHRMEEGPSSPHSCEEPLPSLRGRGGHEMAEDGEG